MDPSSTDVSGTLSASTRGASETKVLVGALLIAASILLLAAIAVVSHSKSRPKLSRKTCLSSGSIGRYEIKDPRKTNEEPRKRK